MTEGYRNWATVPNDGDTITVKRKDNGAECKAVYTCGKLCSTDGKNLLMVQWYLWKPEGSIPEGWKSFNDEDPKEDHIVAVMHRDGDTKNVKVSDDGRLIYLANSDILSRADWPFWKDHAREIEIPNGWYSITESQPSLGTVVDVCKDSDPSNVVKGMWSAGHDHFLGDKEVTYPAIVWNCWKVIEPKGVLIYSKEVQIEHPDYYTWIPGIECWNVIQHFNYNIGAAMKHQWRCGRKPGMSAVKDIEKAIQYLKHEIERIKDEGP